jgi:ubiquinone/menaquinone biosynthesis C-methylase UbiE
MTTVPEQAQAFSDVAQDYERGRPGYPVELAEWMVDRGLLGPNRVAVDVGAGTGKLTRLLRDTGARVLAVEPLEAMRSELERVLPSVESIAGSGEETGVESGIADTVTAAMAFHWFATDTALAEIARVLRDGGEFVIVTTDFERSTALQQRIVEMRAAAQRSLSTTAGTMRWRDVIDGSERFAFAADASFRNEIYLDLEALFDRLRSNSAIAGLPEAARAEQFNELASMVDDPTHIDASQTVRVVSYAKR